VIGSIAAAPVAIALEPAHDVDDLSKYDRYRPHTQPYRTDPSLSTVVQADSRACPHDTRPDPISFVYKSISRRKQRWKPHGWSLIHEVTLMIVRVFLASVVSDEVMQNWIFGVECGIMIKYGFTAGLV
jgi:hypothetical protein